MFPSSKHVSGNFCCKLHDFEAICGARGPLCVLLCRRPEDSRKLVLVVVVAAPLRLRYAGGEVCAHGGGQPEAQVPGAERRGAAAQVHQ